MRGERGQKPSQVEASDPGSAPIAARGAWPGDLESDYATAAIRLATFVRDRVQRLVFACVELYPPEIPAPTVIQEQEHLGKDTLRFSLTPLDVASALAWYEEVAGGHPVVPKMPDLKLEPVSLLPEPASGHFVVGADVPFEPAWHGGARLHRLVNMADPEESVGSIARPQGNDRRWEQARAWLAERLHFDVLASDEWLGGCALLAPNPAARDVAARPVQAGSATAERLRFTATLRTGVNAGSLELRVTELRNGAIANVSSHGLDEFGSAEVDFPQPVDDLEVQLFHNRLGLIYHERPAPRIRRLLASFSVVSGQVKVEVPSPRQRGSSTAYERNVVETAGSTVVESAPPGAASARVEALVAIRNRRTGAMRPGGSAGPNDEYLFDGDREGAADVIRKLLSSARRSVTFVDPYFDEVSLREFGLAVPDRSAIIKILTTHRAKRVEDENGIHPMARFGDELDRVAQLFDDKKLGTFEVKVTGGQTRDYHDRFLIIDEDAWHCGHSFNQVGRTQLSMMTRLRRPQELIATVDADFAAAETFAAAHRHWLSAQPKPPSAFHRLALRGVRRVKKWLEVRG
jgi:hypothetical protein